MAKKLAQCSEEIFIHYIHAARTASIKKGGWNIIQLYTLEFRVHFKLCTVYVRMIPTFQFSVVLLMNKTLTNVVFTVIFLI